MKMIIVLVVVRSLLLWETVSMKNVMHTVGMNKWAILSVLVATLLVGTLAFHSLYGPTELLEVEYQKSDSSLIWGQDCQVIHRWALNLLTNAQHHWLTIWLVDDNYEATQVSFKFNNCSSIDSEWIEDEWIDGEELILGDDSYWRQEYHPDVVGYIWIHIRAYYDYYYIQPETFQRIEVI